MADDLVRYRITMTSVVAGPADETGRPVVLTHQATDYVDVEHIDVYVADARTRWQSVEVSAEPVDPPVDPEAYDLQAAITSPE